MLFGRGKTMQQPPDVPKPDEPTGPTVPEPTPQPPDVPNPYPVTDPQPPDVPDPYPVTDPPLPDTPSGPMV
jgi:hypothetical protein